MGDAVIPVTTGSGEDISTLEVTTLNGGAVASQNIQRVLVVHRIDTSSANDTDAGDPFPVTVVSGTMVFSGENHIGEVGLNQTVITPTITVTAGAYLAGDVIGGRLTLTSAMRLDGGSGTLTDILLTTADAELLECNILIFETTTASAILDNNPFAWGAGDHAKLLAQIPIVTADWATIGGDGVCHKRDLNIGVRGSGTANLYAYIIATGTPTFAATSDLTARFKFTRN